MLSKTRISCNAVQGLALAPARRIPRGHLRQKYVAVSVVLLEASCRGPETIASLTAPD